MIPFIDSFFLVFYSTQAMSSSSASCYGHADGGKSKALCLSSDIPLEEQVDNHPIWALPNLFQQYILEEVRLMILKNIRSTLSII